MTIRERFNRRRRWVRGAHLATSILLTAAWSLVWIGPNRVGVPAGIIALAIFGSAAVQIFAWVASHNAFHCPRCQGNIGWIALQGRNRSGEGQLACCPYCGISLDENVAEQPANAGENWHWASQENDLPPAPSEEMKAEPGHLPAQPNRLADMESGQAPAQAQGMTIRERFTRRKRWLMATLAVCVLLFTSGFFVPQFRSLPVYVIGLIGLSLVLFITLIAHFAFRCPQCRGDMGLLILRGGILSVDDQLARCPYCGVSLDEESAAQQPADVGESW